MLVTKISRYSKEKGKINETNDGEMKECVIHEYSQTTMNYGLL